MSRYLTERKAPPQHCCPAGDLFDAAIERGAYTADGVIASPFREDGIWFSEESASWILDNGEYAGPIFFCPWCGIRLPADGGPDA